MSSRLRCAAIAASAALVAGCSHTASTGSPHAGNPWTIPGVVRISDNQEPNSLLRMFSSQAAADDVSALLFDPLFGFDERGNPVPKLATTFPTQRNGLISPDGLRVTFPLRRSARWSDGAPVTSADVVYTWRAIVGGENPVVSTAGYDDIATMTAQGPYRVTMTLKRPLASAVYLFSEGSFPPLPSHLLAAYPRIDRLPYDAHPIGDGPFELARWDHGADLVFVPNPHYWRGVAHLREIDMRIIPNAVTQIDALRTHEVDVVDGVAKNLVAQASSVPGVTIVKELSANYRHLDFDTADPLLADPVVRRAIAMSIDFDRIIADVYGGYAVRASSTVPPTSWARNDLKPLPFDPAAARSALDAGGYATGPDGIRSKAGRRLSLSISTATETVSGQSAEVLIADDLRRVGIEVRVKNYATPVLFAPDGPLYGGRYQMAWIVDTEGTDPDILGGVGCDYFPPRGANTTFFCDRRVDALLLDAQRRYDPRVRTSDYARAAALLRDDAPFVVVYWDVNVCAANTDLKGFRPSPVLTDFWNAWEWRI